METSNRDLICYNALLEVFTENAYSSAVLATALKSVTDEKDRSYITNLFYGVLEKNVQFGYIIKKLVKRRTKTSIELIIKIGMYHMRNMSTPVYAAINETVELCKKVGKSGVAGFVNAVLRKSESFVLPSEGELPDAEYLSVISSVPVWMVKRIIDEYDYDFAKQFLLYEPIKMTHIRYNSRVTTKEEFEKNLIEGEYKKTKLGYYVTHNQLAKLQRASYTAQSLSSMLAVNYYLISKEKPVVLDLCGAPGGKSIYLEELIKDATIYCCDVHPHRVELIKKYAKRMQSKIVASLSDASVIFPEWLGACDLVICDVPCSGLGVYKNKPDILFNKAPADIDKLRSIQKTILENAKSYVKKGGVLCYSTCTIFKEENENNIEEFLSANSEFSLERIESPYAKSNDGIIKLFPHTDDGCDGFFIARMRRAK